MDGFRAAGTLVIVGIDAVAKARRTGEAILERTRTLLAEAGFADFSATHVEVLGAEASYGPHGRAGAAREVMLRVVADHADARRARDLRARDRAGRHVLVAGHDRPRRRPAERLAADPAVRLPAATRARSRSASRSTITRHPVAVALHGGACPPRGTRAEPPPFDRRRRRRRDDDAAADPPRLGAQRRQGQSLEHRRRSRAAPSGCRCSGTGSRRRAVRDWFAHLMQGEVERFWLPGIGAINFLLHDALDGGGPASHRLDPLGKGMAQMLLDMPIEVPRSIAREISGA